MHGPGILTRSISARHYVDDNGYRWQYHSRSDHHSKVACWAILFDLLRECRLLRNHVETGEVAFGINHEMRDFETLRKKDLDLVICTPRDPNETPSSTFRSLVDKHGIELREDEASILNGFPELERRSVGTVRIALEAKACMTAHGKALPRLHDELNSSHMAVHGSSGSALAVGYVMINAAPRFISPGMNNKQYDPATVTWSSDPQPKSTIRTIAKVKEIPRRASVDGRGFDAMGITVVDCANDGSPLRLVEDADIAPSEGDPFHYGQMIRRLSHLYEQRFKLT